MLAYLRVPIGWREIFRRTALETYEDNCLGLAAQLAFYFFLALFPLLLFLVSLISLLPVENVMDQILRTLGQFAPEDVLRIIRDQVRQIAQGEHGGILTFAILGTIWSSSAAVNAIIDTVNRAYDIQESRSFWKTRSLAILLTVVLAVFVILSFALVLVGPALADRLADRAVLGPVAKWTWKILQWPIVFLLVSLAFSIVYYFAPDAEQQWVWITPGSIVATIVWMVTSLAFRFYVTRFGAYNETYGTIGAFIVLMLWFYLSGLAILIGAELNSEIEHASPHGKDPGEKTMPGRRKLGVLGARVYERARVQRPPQPEGLEPSPNCPVDRPRASRRRARPSDRLIGGTALAAAVFRAVRVGLRASTPRAKA